MRIQTGLPRLAVTALATALVSASVAAPVALGAETTDPDLLVTLELPSRDVEYEVELDTLYLYDDEDAPFAVYVIDGCSVNDHVWVFGAGLSGIPLPLDVLDLRSGKSARIALPAFEPGSPIGTVLDPEALAVCGDAPTGGLPALKGTIAFTSADGRGVSYENAIEVRSDGDDASYRRLIRGGSSYTIVGRGAPVFVVDTSSGFDELMLLAEGRTPRRVEGVSFSGPEGMLPSRAALEKAFSKIDRARVKRAFETARNMRVPRGIIEDLGLTGVDRVYHVGLDLQTLGTDAYLALAGWIRERGRPIDPPVLVEERFSVRLVRASGETSELPLVGPFVGSEAEDLLWEYRGEDALVQVIDACELDGSFWTLAGARTTEPLELLVTDTRSGNTVSQLLWTDREEVSRSTQAGALVDCP